MNRWSTRIAVAALIPAAVGLSACSSNQDSSGDTVRVLAASSLTEAFNTLASSFEKLHPGTKVTVSFGASSTIAEQVKGGAPIDVVATASTATMDQIQQAGALKQAPKSFATNTMEIAVPPTNPGNVTSLSQLADPAVKTVICAKQVPCGVAAQKVFENAKLTVTPISYEADVKAVLARVVAKEAQAGIVYRTDVLASGDKVKGIEIPAAENATTTYPIATVTDSANANEFFQFVLSDEGQAVLKEQGFGSPASAQ